ncbi:hypothetical protein IO99_01990 [Clostridium sulfidigenes]|uniref:Uncharacterized protein n=1 Tax=Clostridium sulfidigenes TaxID=318464 RepID=A0A084JHK5_9CLOT|nr:hypothetical protein IO99_01990 [Clostridium sulfidigenes]
MLNTCDKRFYYMIDTADIEISYYLNNSFELIKDSIEEGIVLDDERICYGFWEDKAIKIFKGAYFKKLPWINLFSFLNYTFSIGI